MELQFVVVATSAELEMAISRYRTWLKSKVAETTQDKYGYHIKLLGSFLADRGVMEPGQITRQHLEEWVAGLHEGWSSSTVHQAVAAARSFVNFLRDVELIRKKLRKRLLKTLTLPKVESNEQRTLSIGEIQRLIAACDLSSPVGRRNLPLLELLVASGLRAAELRRLKVNDLEFGVLLVPEPEVIVNRLTVVIKGNKRRAGYFDDRTAEHLKAWLSDRELIAAPGVEALFVSIGGTTRGHAISEDGLKVILRKIGEKAGVKGVSPHAFRRAFTWLLQLGGANIKTITDLGRWDDPKMPLLYTRGFEAALLYNQYAPMNLVRTQAKG